MKFHKNDIETINKQVGENLAKMRKARNMQQAELAELVGAQGPQIHKFEKGYNRISTGMLFAIASAMDCTVDEFYKGVNITPKVTLSSERRDQHAFV